MPVFMNYFCSINLWHTIRIEKYTAIITNGTADAHDTGAAFIGWVLG